MKHFLLKPIAACLFFAGATLAHGALDNKIVPADSQWVLHLDLEAARTSDIGTRLLAAMPAMESFASHDIGIQPDVKRILDTVGRITAFGTDLSGNRDQVDGTVIVQGRENFRTIADGMLTQMSVSHPDEVVEITDLPFPAYSISKEIIVALPPEPIVIASKSRERLQAALEVYRGKAPSMATKPNALTAMLPKGRHFFVIAASVVPSTAGLFPDTAPQARMLQMATSASVAVGEDKAVSVAQVQLHASSDETADKLRRIVLGITAMLSLAQSNDRELTEFINAVTVERDGSMVTVGFSYPSEKLAEWIEKLKDFGDHDNDSRHHMGRSPTDDMGQVLDEWKADAQLGGDAPTADNMVVHTVENVSLTDGATVVVGGERGDGEHARIDYVDVIPTGGKGTTERYEAEFMRLHNYQIEKSDVASGGEIVRLGNSPGNARFRFKGGAGTYTFKIGYVDETDGVASFAIGLEQTPDAPVEASKK